MPAQQRNNASEAPVDIVHLARHVVNLGPIIGTEATQRTVFVSFDVDFEQVDALEGEAMDELLKRSSVVSAANERESRRRTIVELERK